MELKECTKCGLPKQLSEFPKDSKQSGGLRPECKLCLKEYHKRYYQLNRLKIKVKHIKYYFVNKNQIKEYSKNQYLKNHERELTKRNIYALTHTSERHEYYLKNQRKILERNKNYYLINKKKINHKNNIYQKERKKTDINFKLIGNLRNRINQVLKDKVHSKRTKQLLGCSGEFLKQHLQSQFKDGMTWHNYSLKGWHVDHIKPCAKFDLTKPEEQEKCFHYSNLQPLWALDNLKKNKY